MSNVIQCTHCDEHEPATLDPLGPQCGASATSTILWRDGRHSPSCEKHGVDSLDADAKALVLRVVGPLEGPPTPPADPSTLGALLASLERGETLTVGGHGSGPAHLAELGRDLIRLGIVVQARARELADRG